LENEVRFILVAAFAACFSMSLSSFLFAAQIEELELKRSEAEKFYTENDYKKAYKMYYKLAKSGDHYSQDRVSQMYVKGEGRSVDLTKAYTWSVLAAENGSRNLLDQSAALLEKISDKAAAEKSAEKLMKRYGEVALEKKAANRARNEKGKNSGSCTGSRMRCGR
jgi:TPR repeat protein